MGHLDTLQRCASAIEAANLAVADLRDAAGVARLMAAIADDGGCGYTLHLDFSAADECAAQAAALMLAEALGMLREDVHTHSAAVSVSQAAGGGSARPVFCLADGPGEAICERPAGHDPWHMERGADGVRWGDGDGAPSIGRWMA